MEALFYNISLMAGQIVWYFGIRCLIKCSGALQMSRRIWFFTGAGFGLTVPILLNVMQRLGPWHVRPVAYALFRPGLLVLYAVPRHFQVTPGAGFVILVANAAVFGVVAYGLRNGFLMLVGVLLTINFLSLPPSDAWLEATFFDQKQNFERLVQKSNQTPALLRITTDEIEDADGKTYRRSESQLPLSAESWNEYRELFQKTGMKRGLYRSPQTGQVGFMAVTVLGKVGAVGTLYGYAYCPLQSNLAKTGLLPCIERENEYDILDYRYKRIAQEWFIVQIFETNSLTN